MNFIDKPSDIPLETSLGTIYLTILRKDAVYVNASSNGRKLTYCGKQYAYSCHLHLVAGSWEVRDSYHSFVSPIPPSYEKKIAQVVLQAVTTYLAENPGQLALAERAELNNLVVAAQVTREQAWEDYQTAVRQLEQAEHALSWHCDEVALPNPLKK